MKSIFVSLDYDQNITYTYFWNGEKKECQTKIFFCQVIPHFLLTLEYFCLRALKRNSSLPVVNKEHVIFVCLCVQIPTLDFCYKTFKHKNTLLEDIAFTELCVHVSVYTFLYMLFIAIASFKYHGFIYFFINFFNNKSMHA